ncbi:MAG TPA: FUSC family membrane protein, partial [Rhizomicrobium sp.]|nr:FUSC family membrane protein [Rhizomicrobium sp.]
GGILLGRDMMALGATGALYASIVDQPGPLDLKTRIFAIDIAAAAIVTLLASVAGGVPWLLGPLIVAMGFSTGMLVAYGRRAVGLGVAAVLALLFGMATHKAPFAVQLVHTAIFAGGGIGYALVALALNWLLDDRTRQLYLGEALLAFSRYIAAKAALYDPGTKQKDVLAALVNAHADLVDRLQAARDMIFSGRRTERRARWIASLVALLDTFDTVLSSDADIETLRSSSHHHLLRRFQALTANLADDVRALGLDFVMPARGACLPSRSGQLKAIGEEISRIAMPMDGTAEPADVFAFRATWHKLTQTSERLTRLADLLAGRRPPIPIGDDLDLQRFMKIESASPQILTAQLRFSSPIFRYALRLSLAMATGYLLTVIFPQYIHGGWVMLTTALIMRANYSTTRRRRDDRVVGNLAGCIVTMLLVRFLPGDALSACVVLAIGVSHAFGTVNYRVTAFAACISALLQLHAIAPLSQPLLFERIFDTLIGAGLAWGFSYVFPAWEWRNVPRYIKGLMIADRDYAVQALTRDPSDQAIRLARKRAHDMAAVLCTTVQRLIDEPYLDKRAFVALNELLAANYLLASDLASMRVLFRRRAAELEPVSTEELLAQSRQRATATFALGGDPKAAPNVLSRRSFEQQVESPSAAYSLRRRLVHIDRTSERVAALAARALREAT